MTGAVLKSVFWDLLRRGSSAFIGVVIPSPNRSETVSWYEATGHVEGQLTDWQEAGGLMVRLNVGGLSASGAMLVQAELYNPQSSVWRGGVNLTDRLVNDSEAVLTLAPSGTTAWWSYLSARASQVFVRVDPDARSHF